MAHNNAVGTIIYGSQEGDGKPLPRAEAQMDPFTILNNLFTLPLQIANSMMEAMIPQTADDEQKGVKYRRHTPHGELVQTMSTKDLKAKNIFGAGGSQ